MEMAGRVMSRAFETQISHRAPFKAQQRRVLCATDLSARSAPAIRTAADIANRFDAQLTVLHVVPARRASSRRPEEIHGRLRDQLSSVAEVTVGSAPVLAVRGGDPARMIAQVAQETGAELIVLSAQSKRSLATLRGTTAERVVALARCPVLVVRSKRAVGHDRVIVAADLGPSFDEVIHCANRWSLLGPARLSVVHGFQSPYRGPLYAEGYDLAAELRQLARWKRVAKEHLLKKLNVAGVRAGHVELRIEEKSPLALLRKEVRRSSAPLVVLGTSAHTPLTRLVRGSLANDVLLSFDCDVLICPSSPSAGLH
jgi:universal stress protein E